MISGGIFKEGLGQLIFLIGNGNSFAYKQVLNFYKEDMVKFGPKSFLQYGATAHSSMGSKEEINKLSEDLYIPTWEDRSELGGKTIPKWSNDRKNLKYMYKFLLMIEQLNFMTSIYIYLIEFLINYFRRLIINFIY